MIARLITIIVLPIAILVTFGVVFAVGVWTATKCAYYSAMMETIPARKVWKAKSIRRENWK